MRKLGGVVLVVLAGCHTTGGGSAPGASMYSGGDGLSRKSAIVVNAKNEFEGTDAVYVWLRGHCNCKVKGQSLVTEGRRAYDVMNVVFADGTESSYYFDITQYFGKL